MPGLNLKPPPNLFNGRLMNFDERLRSRKTPFQYHEDKVKGGRTGSSAGFRRPYARSNMRKALLYSPKKVGQSISVVPKHYYKGLAATRQYEWQVLEPGYGTINGMEFSADEIAEHFIVRMKGKNK